MNLNNNCTASNQLTFSPYEVQQPLHSGLPSCIPNMPGFTPCLIKVPAFPQDAFQPMQPQFNMQNMQGFNPFLLPNPLLPMSNNSASPVFIPLQPLPSMSPPMLSLPQMVPPPVVSVSQPPQMTPSGPPQNRPQFLGNDLRERSRSRSVCSDSGSVCSEDPRARMRSVSRESSEEVPSKRALVDSTLGWMESVFGDKYDNDGTRGENVLRLKVKTVIALEHIVEFISRCHSEGLIESISCPVSTKKGRQHVRGYLAYIKGFSGSSADRITEIFEVFNQEKGFPFKTLHRNPASTL